MSEHTFRDPKIGESLARILKIVTTQQYQDNARRLAAEDALVAEADADRARRRRLIDGRVPTAFWDALRNPEPTEALTAVQRHLVDPPECVFLSLAGPRGRGKTTALAWAVTEYGGLYIEAHELIRLGTFNSIWDEAAGARVLALDELGAEYMNDAYRASLYDLLNARYSNHRKTIIATNLDASAFKARYCPDANDRLAERIAKGGKWVNLPGESMRRPWQAA
jgi:DNA replication protein DnaC